MEALNSVYAQDSSDRNRKRNPKIQATSWLEPKVGGRIQFQLGLFKIQAINALDENQNLSIFEVSNS